MELNGRSHLATWMERGPPRLNPRIPKTIRVGDRLIRVHDRVRRHEMVERPLEQGQGWPHWKAHRVALQREHEGLTRHEVAVYEGILGAVARWHPMKWPEKR